MQLIFINDLKRFAENYKNEDAFIGMLENGHVLGRKVKASLRNNTTETVGQYVRVPKYYCDESRYIESTDEQDRLLILTSFWIVAFSNRNGAKGRLQTLGKSLGIETDYLKFLIEKYGKSHGLSVSRVMTSNGQRHEIVAFKDPRSINKKYFEEIF
ncbi:MAG: hypothetical protein ACRC6V_07155 [Bacteroidales bacterium]